MLSSQKLLTVEKLSNAFLAGTRKVLSIKVILYDQSFINNKISDSAFPRFESMLRYKRKYWVVIALDIVVMLSAATSAKTAEGGSCIYYY